MVILTKVIVHSPAYTGQQAVCELMTCTYVFVFVCIHIYAPMYIQYTFVGTPGSVELQYTSPLPVHCTQVLESTISVYPVNTFGKT